MIVFYSWQSDLPNATNRGFIQKALEDAAEQIRKDETVDVQPAVDRDTLGLPGSPSIDEAIFEKIAKADVYVADISIVNRDHLALAAQHMDEAGKKKLRPTPNPNVLLELGFAVRTLGWERIILVFNTVTGVPGTDLPFDLRQKKRIEYASAPDDTDRATPRKVVTAIFDDAIRTIAKHHALLPVPAVAQSAIDTAIEAVENQTPARKARVRDAWTWMFAELARLQPDLRTNPATEEHFEAHLLGLKDSIQQEGPIAAAWSRLCEAIALTNDAESAEALTKGFGDLLAEYDHKPGWSGISYATWFDYWKFVGHELYTVWIGCLLKEERWHLLDVTLERAFTWEQKRARTNNGNAYFDEFSDFVHLLGTVSQRKGRLSYHADLLSERYGEGGIKSRLTFVEFINAEVFLFLAAQFRLGKGFGGWLHWRPWSVLYMKHEPDFLVQAASGKYFDGLKVALGEADSEAVRSILKERIPKLGEMWRGGYWHNPIRTETLNSLGSKT